MFMMNMISMPGGGELIILAIILIYFVAVVGTLISIWSRPDLDLQSRLLWTLIILVAPLIGVILYSIVGGQSAKAR
jgi:hypothetical protein